MLGPRPASEAKCGCRSRIQMIRRARSSGERTRIGGNARGGVLALFLEAAMCAAGVRTA